MQRATWNGFLGWASVLVCWSASGPMLASEQDSYEGQNWYRMATLRYELNNDLYLFALEAERSKEAALLSGNCDSINYARFADMLNKISRNDSWQLDAELAAADCQWEGSPLFHLAALEAFARQDFKEAESLFRQAVEWAKTEIFKTEIGAREGLAASLANQYRFKEALECIRIIHDTDPDNTQPNTLNNFAYFSLATGNCAEAVMWSELALERLNVVKGNEPNFDFQHAGQWNVSYLNLMHAALAMGDRDLAARALGGLDLKGRFDGREVHCVALLTLYCQWIDNPDLFGLLKPDLEKMLGGVDPQNHADVLGANAVLFGEGNSWRDKWVAQLKVPVIFRGGALEQCATAEPVELGTAAATAFPLGGFFAVGVGVLLLAFVAFFRQLRIQIRVRELSFGSRGVWQSIVEDQLTRESKPSHFSRVIGQRRALAAFNLLLHSVPSESLSQLPGWEEWSPIEQEVASGLVLGERTKAIATRLGVTLNQVYSARKSIRERLGLTEEETLEKWLKSNEK